MNLKYPEKKIGDNVAGTLYITVPIIRYSKRRLFKAQCSICSQEKEYRHDSLLKLKGCTSQCQNKPKLTGLKKKYYTVLYPIKGRESFWKCMCFCGKEFNRKSDHIQRGIVRGCGCMKLEALGKRKQLTLESLLRNRYIKQARNAKREFKLTFEQFLSLIKQNCHYCGSPPYCKFISKGCVGDLVYNGIDRKDNQKGYTIKNALPCCKRCNYAKGQDNYEQMLTWITQIKNYERPK